MLGLVFMKRSLRGLVNLRRGKIVGRGMMLRRLMIVRSSFLVRGNFMKIIFVRLRS